MKRISYLAKSRGIKLHLDGARLWNASIETGISIKEYCSLFDSVSLCLSKGLGAPIGSVLVGSEKFITQALRFRKLFGGGWRQAGILAAAGMHAIQYHFKDLSIDHSNARYLTESLLNMGFKLSRPTETNMLWIDCSEIHIKQGCLTFDFLSRELEKMDCKIPGGTNTARFVIHRDVDRNELIRFVDCIKIILDKNSL